MVFQQILNNFRRQKETYKELEAQDKAQQKLAFRKLSPSEQALAKLKEREHQKAVKNQVAAYTKRDTKEYWHKDVINQKDLFSKNKNLMTHDTSILHQKNLFTGGQNLFAR